MIVHVELLGQAQAVRDLLLADGWEVEAGPEHSLLLTHRDVPDEEAARGRLDRLGLLTSPSLRVDFGPPPPAR